MDELREIVDAERKIVGPITRIVLLLGIGTTGIAVFLAGWDWLWLIITPLIMNWLIVYRSCIRISKDTGISSIVVNNYWRKSQIEQSNSNE